MKKYTYIYQKASSRVFEGTYLELVDELARTGECIQGRKGAKYFIGTPASGYIYEVDSEKFGTPHRVIDAKPYIRNVLKKERITEADYKRLTLKLNNGSINFEELYDMYGFVGEWK